MNNIEICILAAGMGTRMKSAKPKVLHTIAHKPMLAHLLDTAMALTPNKIHVVIGSGADQVKATFSNQQSNQKTNQKVIWVTQSEQLGTGHAVMQAAPGFDPSSRVLLLVGDAPLLQLDTMKTLLSTSCDLGVLTVEQSNPHNYGRIIRDGDQLTHIVEEKDASDKQRQLNEVNTGVMVANAEKLMSWLEQLDTDNAQGEYLLTDIVEIANRDQALVRAIKIDDADEVQGVNNFSQLAQLERYYQLRLAQKLMLEGVHILDPARIDIRGDLKVGQDTSIDINCIFEGKVSIGSRVSIGANCIIKDSVIGDGTIIKPNTMLDGGTIADECSVGPFARIRPGTVLSDEVAIGNFVEIKKTSLGKGSKSSHLAYLGDAIIGSGVNIGAGTITCNYDGVNKHVTEIADNVFVGSNSALVAPVMIGEGSTIAAGSTITKLVDEHSLGIARGKQKNIKGWNGPRNN